MKKIEPKGWLFIAIGTIIIIVTIAFAVLGLDSLLGSS